MAGLDDELLAKYLAGEASAAERARVEDWARADGAKAAELRELTQAWAARPPAGSWDVDRAWARVRDRLDRPADLPRPSARRWAVYALAALVLLAVGLFVSRPWEGPTEYVTKVGAQRAIDLPDGSRVVLAPASRLALLPHYGDGAREVQLEGRAWFEVEHDASRPFRVRTSHAMIEDLGTAFEVLTPVGDGPLQVAVVEGSVRVQWGDTATPRSVTLGPRDVARVSDSDDPVVRREAPVQRLTAWREGHLDFDDAPLPDVVAEIGRWYGVPIRVADPVLARRTFSSTFPTDDLDEVIAVLGLALGADVSRVGDTLVLARRRAP